MRLLGGAADRDLDHTNRFGRNEWYRCEEAQSRSQSGVAAHGGAAPRVPRSSEPAQGMAAPPFLSVLDPNDLQETDPLGSTGGYGSCGGAGLRLPKRLRRCRTPP